MKNENYDHRLPRLFVNKEMEQGQTLLLEEESAHYLKNVLRRKDGSQLRLFNGRQGEFMARLDLSNRKKTVLIIDALTRSQIERKTETHLIFAPIKKDRMDFMIEKAVELGTTHFHPVLTQQTIIREINEDRLTRQIVEAAEQCERLDVPSLLPIKKLDIFLKEWAGAIPLYVALERVQAKDFETMENSGGAAFLIGPEGGFSEAEREMFFKHAKVTPVSLGKDILRAETAALYGLSLLKHYSK